MRVCLSFWSCVTSFSMSIGFWRFAVATMFCISAFVFIFVFMPAVRKRFNKYSSHRCASSIFFEPVHIIFPVL